MSWPWAWACLLAVLALALLPVSRVTIAELAWARDRWLLFILALGVLRLALEEWSLALIALAVLAQWRGPDQVPSVVLYAVLIGQWLLVAEVAPLARVWLPWGLAGVAMIHTGVLVLQRIQRRPLRGLLGHRTFSAGALVLTLPFVPVPLVGMVALGLCLTRSLLAWIAGAVALGMLWPWTVGVTGPLAGVLGGLVILGRRWPGGRLSRAFTALTGRGPSLKTLRARWEAWRALWEARSWWGRGPGFARRHLARAAVACGGHAHCEPLEYAVEYGVLGVLAMLGVAIRVLPHLRWHDPWSAAVVGGTLLFLASTPARVAPVGALWWAEVAVVAA